MRHRQALGVVLLAVAAAACSGASGETPPEPIPTTTPTSTPPTTPPPTTSPPATNVSTGAAVADAVTADLLAQGPALVTTGGPSGSGCSPGGGTDDLPPGWWAGEVTGVHDGALEFNLVCFYLGVGAATAAAEHGEADAYGDHYLVNDNPRTFDVELPAPSSPASCVPAGGGTDFPCEARHILELYGSPQQYFTMQNGELVPVADMTGDVLQGSFLLWVHVGADGRPDYATMQWSC